jgi:superfamily II DNA/RNA helicase
MIKSRRMRWAGHVARMGEKGNAYMILVGKPEDQDVDEWTILKEIIEK